MTALFGSVFELLSIWKGGRITANVTIIQEAPISSLPNFTPWNAPHTTQNTQRHKAVVHTEGSNPTGVHSAPCLSSLLSSVVVSFSVSSHLSWHRSIWTGARQVFCWLSLVCEMFSHWQWVDTWGTKTTEARVLCWCSVGSGPALQQSWTGTCAKATWDQGPLRNPRNGCKES